MKDNPIDKDSMKRLGRRRLSADKRQQCHLMSKNGEDADGVVVV